MSEPLPQLPDYFYDYLLDTESAGFNEDCSCVCCQMTREGFTRWLKAHQFLEWEAAEQQKQQQETKG